MKYIYNNNKLKKYRRKLRNNQTEHEEKLWSHLRCKRFYDLKFIRQYSVGRYILDFNCPKLRLAIEVDGGQHTEYEIRKNDIKRTNYLKEVNIKVIRFWNHEITENIDGVLEKIYCITSKLNNENEKVLCQNYDKAPKHYNE